MLSELERFPLVILPGLGDSGPEHWQTYWEAAHPDSRRFTPRSFEQPDLDDWVEAIDRAVSGCDAPPLIAAHSGGSLALVEWASRVAVPGRVVAVLLVAPPDPSQPALRQAAPTFAAVRPAPLGVASALVASTNDPWASVDYAASLAAGCGAVLHTLGALGHINAETGLGEWREGQRILADLVT